MPKRVQLRRSKGWRKPEGVVVVARPSRWGNPVKLGEPHPVHGRPITRDEMLDLYRAAVGPGGPHELTPEDLAPLRGRDLACWCRPDQPCHADVLLELANR